MAIKQAMMGLDNLLLSDHAEDVDFLSNAAHHVTNECVIEMPKIDGSTVTVPTGSDCPLPYTCTRWVPCQQKTF